VSAYGSCFTAETKRSWALTVVLYIVVAQDDIDVLAVLVLDEEVRESSSVGDKLYSVSLAYSTVQYIGAYLRLDTISCNGVPSISIRLRLGGCSSSRSDQRQDRRTHIDERLRDKHE
jgi:hypothetical protein